MKAKKNLYNEGLALESGGQANHVHVLLIVNEGVDAVEDTTSSGTYSTMNTSLGDGLPGDAGISGHISVS